VRIWKLFNDLDVLDTGNVHHHRPALPWTPEEREHRVRFDNRRVQCSPTVPSMASAEHAGNITVICP
jgi:hypothetical protein